MVGELTLVLVKRYFHTYIHALSLLSRHKTVMAYKLRRKQEQKGKKSLGFLKPLLNKGCSHPLWYSFSPLHRLHECTAVGSSELLTGASLLLDASRRSLVLEGANRLVPSRQP